MWQQSSRFAAVGGCHMYVLIMSLLHSHSVYIVQWPVFHAVVIIANLSHQLVNVDHYIYSLTNNIGGHFMHIMSN